jgi:hypothetical protein
MPLYLLFINAKQGSIFMIPYLLKKLSSNVLIF